MFKRLRDNSKVSIIYSRLFVIPGIGDIAASIIGSQFGSINLCGVSQNS